VWFDRGQHAHTKTHGFGSMRCAADASATPKACERRLRFASSLSSCESLKMRPRVATLTWKVSGASSGGAAAPALARVASPAAGVMVMVTAQVAGLRRVVRA
jgi:hypothetical protein